MSVDTGSFTGPPDTFVNAAGTRLVRDSLGLNFAHNGSTFVNRQSSNQASVKRPFMTSEPIYTPDDYASPVMVRAGGYDWTFFVDDGVYGYVVRDSATNRIVRTITRHSVAGLAHICPVTDGTTIFVFIAIASTTIRLDRYTAASPSTARTTTTYQTVASAVHNCVDAMVDDANDVYVVASSSEAANFRFTHSKLDKATGQAAASPAPVTTNGTKGAGEQCNGCSWLVNAGGSTIYYTIARPGTAGTTALYVYSITKSTLAIAAGTVQLNIGALTNAVQTTAPATCGYWDGSQPITYIGYQNVTGTRDDAERFIIRKVVGLGGTATTVGRNCWIASKPFQVSSAWYLLTATSQPGLGVYQIGRAHV